MNIAGPRRCPQCHQRRHNAGNFWLQHSETYHWLMRIEKRRSRHWRLILAAAVAAAAVRHLTGLGDIK